MQIHGEFPEESGMSPRSFPPSSRGPPVPAVGPQHGSLQPEASAGTAGDSR